MNRPAIKIKTTILFLLCLLLALAACSGRSDTDPTPTPANNSDNTNQSTDGDGNQPDSGIRIVIGGGDVAIEENPFGETPTGSPRMGIQLSAGSAQPDAIASNAVVDGEPLSAETTQQILDRLPDLITDPSDEQAFNLPPQSLPRPVVGETVEQPFGEITDDGSQAPAASDVPLEVLRFSPEGEVPLAPFFSITFNQPMVELATLEQLADQVPVQLTPDVPGNWRWLGTKTLRFDHTGLIDRLPMATEYVATIPAGTTSANGNSLAEDATFTFSTPRPQVVNSYPRDGAPQPLTPVMFVEFDQRIDQQAVINTITGTASGSTVALRLATDDEITADETVARLRDNAQPDRWLAFVAEQPLPTAASIVVTVGPDTPSAEGPLRTTEPQNFRFATYQPLRIERHECGWGGDCPPLTPFNINFNNPIDETQLTDSMITIEPEIPNAVVQVFGSQLQISGVTQGRTTYTVNLSGDLTDIFGQTLGDDVDLRFEVGSAEPLLTTIGDTFATVDPSLETPAISIYSINVDQADLVLRAVTPADWGAFQRWQQERWNDNPPEIPGEEVVSTRLNFEGEQDALTETSIDLWEALAAVDADNGQFIMTVTPRAGLFNRSQQDSMIYQWVQVTQIGLDAFADSGTITVWTTNLQDGTPLADTTVKFVSRSGGDGASAITAADGTANIDLTSSGQLLLVAERDGDTAVLSRFNSFWDDGWQSNSQGAFLQWHVFDDRAMYRPDETVSLKGWVRQIDRSATGDIGFATGVEQIEYTIYGPQGNELARDSAELSPLGGFDITLTLPENVNLGWANVEFRATNGTLGTQYHSHSFQIQEFRRPEFEVTARNETFGPYFAGGHAVVGVTASYFSGGPLPDADVTWSVNSSPSSYSPPNWRDFSFGIVQPFWYFYEEEPFFGGERNGGTFESFGGSTDASGDHYLRLDFDQADLSQPLSISAEASVMDVNRQAWAASTNLLVHPSAYYVGLRSDRYFVRQGTPLTIESIVSDIDGNAVADVPVELTADRLEWRYTNGRWGEEVVASQTCQITSASDAASCDFETNEGGQYRITAVVLDEQGRRNSSQITRYVSGGRARPSRNIEQEQVTIIPDKDGYEVGDSAELLIVSPFSPAEGLLTVSRGDVLYTERFTVQADSHILTIPISDAHLPNLNVQVDLVGAAVRTSEDGTELTDLPARPAYARGSTDLSISLATRELAIALQPAQTSLAPGGSTTLDLTVTDSSGSSVGNAEVAVIVVDEAVLALSNYQLRDPLSSFYTNRWPNLQSSYARASIVLANPDLLQGQVSTEQSGLLKRDSEIVVAEVMEEAAGAPEMAMAMSFDEADDAMMEDSGGATATGPAIALRTNFDPLAIFAPTVTTDASGNATVAVDLPDNLTRYRVMAVAVASDNLAGSAESNITARLPLMVRPSAPRFLNFGDQFELPVVVQNQTDEPLDVLVAVNATNLDLAENGVSVSVPANDRVEVRFPTTTASAGTARLQFAAVSGDFADAAEISLPVYTPATTEAFATYGVVDEGATVQPLAAIEGVWPQFGGLEIGTSSTAVQALTDAVIYLYEYRYPSAEALSSRIAAITALSPILDAFQADGLPDVGALEAAVQRDIDALVALQNGDGGYSWWRRNAESVPLVTIHATHALLRANDAAYSVPLSHIENGLVYLRDIENRFPSYYSQETRWNITAQALMVRHLAAEDVAGEAADLYKTAGDALSADSKAWIWLAIGDNSSYQDTVAEIERDFANSVVETAASAQFTTRFSEQEYLLLRSNRRTDAIVLNTLIEERPDSDLIPKVVNGLLASRERGRWGNTQENVFVLLTMNNYFNTFEAQTPDFVARIWLGDDYAAEHVYEGRTTERNQTNVPMNYLIDNGAADITLSKEGEGRLYYRLGLRYAPDDLELDALDAGFVVKRAYEAVDDPADVYQDEDGIWHVKAGAQVRVRLTLVAEAQRNHVALVDPLPAGLEIVNPALAVSGNVPSDPSEPSRSWWWYWTWYDHQNNRDDRAEAFATYLWSGVYDYDYVARATTPGRFVVPPTKAEEMYAPETFGRTSTDILIVEE